MTPQAVPISAQESSWITSAVRDVFGDNDFNVVARLPASSSLEVQTSSGVLLVSAATGELQSVTYNVPAPLPTSSTNSPTALAGATLAFAQRLYPWVIGSTLVEQSTINHGEGPRLSFTWARFADNILTGRLSAELTPGGLVTNLVGWHVDLSPMPTPQLTAKDAETKALGTVKGGAWVIAGTPLLQAWSASPPTVVWVVTLSPAPIATAGPNRVVARTSSSAIVRIDAVSGAIVASESG